MDSLMYVVMGFGVLLALIGIVLFARKGSEGTNSIKMFGFEFQLAGSALVIFVTGALIFLVPILYSEKFSEPNRSSDQGDARRIPPSIADTSSQTVSKAPLSSETMTTSTPNSPVASLPTEIRDLVANHLKVRPENIEMSTPLQRQPIRFDELDFLEIVMEIEERYGVHIDDNEVKVDRVSIDDLTRAVEKKQRAR